MGRTSDIIRLFREIFAGSRPFMGLLTLIILMGTSYLIITFLGLLLAMPFFSISWQELQHIIEGGMDEINNGLLYYLQAIQTTGLFLVPALIARTILFDQSRKYFPERYSGNVLTGFLVLLTLLISAPVLQWIIKWNIEIKLPDALKQLETTLRTMEEERIQVAERLMAGRNWHIFFIDIVVISILPALGEEFFFRGTLQRILANWFRNMHLGIFITAICFSASHFQFYGFFPRLLLGIYFGYLYYWSRNIWIPALAHFLNNTIAISLSFLVTEPVRGISGLFSWLGNTSVMILIPSIVISTMLIVLTYRILSKDSFNKNSGQQFY